jgi:hypothetical protein
MTTRRENQMVSIQSNAAKQYLAALQAQEAATNAVATAKALLCEALEYAGDIAVEVDGQKVMMVEAIRRTFDAQALAGLVDEATFALVTKATVDSKAWDKARKQRLVSDEVEATIIKETPYIAIRVSDLAEETATDKVA